MHAENVDLEARVGHIDRVILRRIGRKLDIAVGLLLAQQLFDKPLIDNVDGNDRNSVLQLVAP
jgi:hypothetical protein